MTARRDMVIRVIGDVLNVAVAAAVALTAAHPSWAWLAAIVPTLKLAQKAFVTVQAEMPGAVPEQERAVGK